MDTYETEDLFDGRIALKRNGLVVYVGRSAEDIMEWLGRRRVAINTLPIGQAVQRVDRWRNTIT